LRKFVAGEAGIVGALADRITGSPSLYQSNGHLPINSVNFITAHDGFTLNDLVSYNNKHNEANGEGNRDGVDDNMSWNCGAEGPTDDPAINALREQQIRNFATLLMLSQGVPMFVMGDEVRRTQGGNNNAWCQDNPIGWFDWSQTETESGMLRFWSELIAFRKAHPAVHRARFFSGATNERGMKDIEWHGTKLNEPGWNDPHARALAWTVAGSLAHADIHVMVNMYWEPLTFEVPQINERAWYKAVDTALPSPQDINAPGNEVLVNSHHVEVAGRSIVVLISR
jgi:glycogen operon protein